MTVRSAEIIGVNQVRWPVQVGTRLAAERCSSATLGRFREEDPIRYSW